MLRRDTYLKMADVYLSRGYDVEAQRMKRSAEEAREKLRAVQD